MHVPTLAHLFRRFVPTLLAGMLIVFYTASPPSIKADEGETAGLIRQLGSDSNAPKISP